MRQSTLLVLYACVASENQALEDKVKGKWLICKYVHIHSNVILFFLSSLPIRPCQAAAILSRETKKALFYHAKPHPHGFHCEAWRGKTKLFWSPGTIWPPCDKGELTFPIFYKECMGSIAVLPPKNFSFFCG